MKNNSCARMAVALICWVYLPHENIAKADNTDAKRGTTCEQKLSIEEFRAYALNNSPLVAEIDRDYANDLARAFETEVLTNPELQVEQTFTRMELGGDNDPQNSIILGQPLKISNFGAKEKVASLIRKASNSQKKVKLLEINQKLAVQFYTLEALQQTEKIISDAEERSSKKVNLIKEGVRKGLLSVGDEKLFEGEKYRLQAQRKGLAANIANLQNEVAKTLGSPCSIIVTTQPKLDEIPSEEALFERARSSDLSEGTRINLLDELATEQTRLAELDAYPQLTPRLIYQHTNDGGDFIGAGISIPLPFWDRNQGERIRAHAEQNAVQKRKIFLLNGGFESQIRTLRNSAVSSKEQAVIFSSKVVPSFEAALHSQEKLYAEGKGNILEVWQTLRTYNEVQVQALSYWLEAVTARVQLSIIVGEEI